MGFKSLFEDWTEPDPEKKESNPAPVQPTSPEPQVHSSVSVDTNAFLSSNSNEIPVSDSEKEDEIKKLFLNILKKADQQGLDYYEFREALKKLEVMNPGMPEVQRFQSVWVGFEVQGCTLAHMIETANLYLQVLKEKKAGLDDAIKAKEQEEVGDLQGQIKNITDASDEFNKQVEELKRKIATNQEKIIELNAAIDTNSKKLKNRKVLIDKVYESNVESISSDIVRIEKYLKPNTSN